MSNVRFRSLPDKWEPALLAGFFLFLLLLFNAVGSRGGLGSLIFVFATLTFSVVLFEKRIKLFEALRPNAVRLIPLLMVIFLLLVPALYIQKSFQKKGGIRVEHFKGGVKVGARNPLFGGGTESYGWYNETFLRPIGRASRFHSTHNQILQLYAGQGAVGVLIFLWIIYRTLSLLMRSISEEEETRASRSALLAGLVGILFYLSFQEWFYLRVIQLQWWILPGMILPIRNPEREEPPSRYFLSHPFLRNLQGTAGKMALGGTALLFALLVGIMAGPSREWGVTGIVIREGKIWKWALGNRSALRLFPGATEATLRMVLPPRSNRRTRETNAHPPFVRKGGSPEREPAKVEVLVNGSPLLRAQVSDETGEVRIPLPSFLLTRKKDEEFRIGLRCEGKWDLFQKPGVAEGRKICLLVNLSTDRDPVLNPDSPRGAAPGN